MSDQNILHQVRTANTFLKVCSSCPVRNYADTIVNIQSVKKTCKDHAWNYKQSLHLPLDFNCSRKVAFLMSAHCIFICGSLFLSTFLHSSVLEQSSIYIYLNQLDLSYFSILKFRKEVYYKAGIKNA